MNQSRILVVEDEALIGESLRDRLLEMGQEVVAVVASGEEAVELAAKQKVDLVLMDIRLRGALDGIEAASRIQEENDAAIVYLTAHADDATLTRAKRTRPSGYLLKPIDDRELGIAIDLAILALGRDRERAASEKRMSSTLMSLGDAVIAADATGRITMMNPVAESLTGWRDEDALGAPIDQVFRVIDAKTRAARTNVVAKAMVEGRIIHDEEDALLIARDGREIPIEDSAAPMLGDERLAGGAVLVFRDRTMAKRAEILAREADERRQDSRRMEAIGRLAGGVAHDVNNCMTIVIGYGELVLSDLPRGSPLAPAVESIKKAGERAATMARQLLAFSRQQVLMPSEIDLNAFVSRELPRLRGAGEDRIEIVTEFDVAIGAVKVDPEQLRHVLDYLVSNARDAMRRDGRLTITTRQHAIPEGATVDQPEVRPGEYVELSLKDTGIGMDAHTRMHLFEPFFTTKEVGKGSGLGLATVYGIVKQSGGYITVESEPARGTKVSVFFPRAEPKTSAPAPRSIAGPRRASILLVEDEDLLRRLTHRFLVEEGYEVHDAADGIEALQLYGGSGTHLDLVLTDAVMPRMSGRAMVEQLRKANHRLKVLYMSGFAPDDILSASLAEGQALFLAKPFSREELLNKVQLALDRPVVPRG